MARRNMVSYFADERVRNKNPNFYVNMRDDDLRRNVRRIIRDVKNNSIEDVDLIYFQKDKILSACITESYSQWRKAETNKNALLYYLSGPLANGNISFQQPNINIWEERANASNEVGKITNKANLWFIAYQVFMDISKGADIRLALSNICKIDSKIFYDL